MNLLVTNLQQRLKANNPQMYKQLNQWMKENKNPMDLFKQMTNNYTPQQMQNIMGIAKGFGVPDSVISQIQNIK